MHGMGSVKVWPKNSELTWIAQYLQDSSMLNYGLDILRGNKLISYFLFISGWARPGLDQSDCRIHETPITQISLLKEIQERTKVTLCCL